MQEVISAKAVYMCCGKDFVDWDDVYVHILQYVQYQLWEG